MNVYAFGSTRLPPAPGDRSDDRPRLVRLDNLFDPRYPLSRRRSLDGGHQRVNSRTFSFPREGAPQAARARRRRTGRAHARRARNKPARAHAAHRRLQRRLPLDRRLRHRPDAQPLRPLGLDRHCGGARAGRRARGPSPPELAHDRRRSAARRVPAPPLRGDDARPALPARRRVRRGARAEARRGHPGGPKRRSATSHPASTADELLTGAGSGWRRRSTAARPRSCRSTVGSSSASRPPPAAGADSEIEAELRRRRGTFAETSDERLVRSVVAELRESRSSTGTQRAAAKQAVLQRVRARREPEPPE